MKKTVIGALLLSSVLFALAGNGTTVSADEVKENDNVYYVVEEGDTLSAIAEKYGVDFTVIHGNNEDEVTHADTIEIGQKLLVDGKDFDKEKSVAYVAPEPVVVYVPEAEVAYTEPVYEETYVAETYVAPAQASSYTGSSSSAKEWIAQKESGGSYTATNGQYYGRYQLNPSLYVGYDTTPAGQEAAADAYVAERYGSWETAQQFWINNGWY